LLSDAIVFSFSFFRNRFFTASARAGPEVGMFPYQDFSRKSSSFDFRVGFGMIIPLSTGRRRFRRQAGGRILDNAANRSDKIKGNMGLHKCLSSRRRKKILRHGESPIVLDRVLFFSYASTPFIIVLEKTGAWRIAPVPDPDFTQAPARRTDRSGRQSMSTLKRSHHWKSGLKKREQSFRAPGNPIFKARTL
jgi:hypothetical protein